MKTRKLYIVLVVLGFFLTVLFSTQSITAQTGTTLTAHNTTDSITLDGDASETAWSGAEALTITDVDGSGIDVTLKALTDGSDIYIYATWNDDTENATRKGWSHNGTHWSNVGGNEDRISIIWGVDDASVICGHDPGTEDSMLFDVWHWKATRTALGGWADDKYWDGTGRHSDAKTAGGYSDNSVVAQAADAAAITSALGNSSAVSAFSDDDRPYWDNAGDIISWTNGANATPVGDFINGYKTVAPTGSRGDVLTGSTHNGTAWNVEFKRTLDTGNSDDDVAFEVDTPVSFYLAIFDNTGDGGHFKAGGYTPTTFDLNIPSPVTTTPPPTTPPPTDNLLLYAGIAAVGIVVVAAILVFLRRGK